MSTQPAQYLLRIDDLCPTVWREGWDKCLSLVAEFGVRPLLAVVPDNRDPDLARSPADAGFWDTLRALERAGAAVGLHGYRHRCASRGASLLALHRTSEFAGVPYVAQLKWIRQGLAILHGHGLSPRVWIAPRHGFDRHTLAALRDEGIHYLSDGLSRVPVQRQGIIWIPQQLWRGEERRNGLWTICFHPNTATARDFEDLRSFVREHAGAFTSFDDVVSRWSSRPSLSEDAYAWIALRRLRLQKAMRMARAPWS